MRFLLRVHLLDRIAWKYVRPHPSRSLKWLPAKSLLAILAGHDYFEFSHDDLLKRELNLSSRVLTC